MSEKNLIGRIEACKTMPELDSLRTECVNTGRDDEATFRTIQSAFIKKKNQLKRVPLSKRIVDGKQLW